MNTPMTYNGYSALIEFDSECESFHGEILDINDTITFYADSVDGLKQAMKDAVDDYLEHCEEIGKTPEKPYSGKISLRMPTKLHKKTSRAATMRGISINAFVVECIERELDGQKHDIIKIQKEPVFFGTMSKLPLRAEHPKSPWTEGLIQ